jgi:predicted transcriptional regulator
MRTRNITVGIRSLEEGLKDFSNAYHSIRHGKIPRSKKERVDFVSIEAMRRVLTPKRLQLLRLIREKRPDSIYELTRLIGRDLKNVQSDVSLLARIGLLDLTRSKQARARMIPRVEYDRLQLQIPLA